MGAAGANRHKAIGQTGGEIGATVVHGPVAKPRNTTSGPRIGMDLTGEAGQRKFERLPRCAAGMWCVGVRAILENSTACQKSMPSFASVCIVAFGLLCGLGYFFG